MNAEDFKTLFRYNAWANRRTVEACAGLRAAQFTKDLESSFRSVRDTLVHIMAVERVWLDRWKLAWDGSFLKAAGFPDIESVRTAWVPIEGNCSVLWTRSATRARKESCRIKIHRVRNFRCRCGS